MLDLTIYMHIIYHCISNLFAICVYFKMMSILLMDKQQLLLKYMTLYGSTLVVHLPIKELNNFFLAKQIKHVSFSIMAHNT